LPADKAAVVPPLPPLAPPVPAAYSAFPDPLRWGSPRQCSLLGCKVGDWCAGVPVPLGQSVNSCISAQVDNARAEFFVLYPCEWTCDGLGLNPCGLNHLDRIAMHLNQWAYPVRVVPTCSPEVDQLRLLVVRAMLKQHGFEDATERVILAPPVAEGLRYDEIERVGTRAVGGTTPQLSPVAPLAFPPLLR
jgi:hypothetical protein